jgi:hypothetical protein
LTCSIIRSFDRSCCLYAQQTTRCHARQHPPCHPPKEELTNPSQTCNEPARLVVFWDSPQSHVWGEGDLVVSS